MSIRYFSLFLISVLLANCSAPNQTKKLLDTINTNVEKEYRIKNGYLIATYDLAKINQDNGIYSKNFVKIINESSSNSQFLAILRTKLKNIKMLESESLKKISKIKALITKLNNKYRFLSKVQLARFSNTEKTNSISELSKIDLAINMIPILLPQYQPVVTSYYGNRKNPFFKKEKMHFGIDLFSRQSNSGVYSTANGRVVRAQKNKNGFGNIIEISHDVFTTRYAHLKKMYVKEGDIVLRGQKIGLQGSTGRAKKEHLHYEILLNGKHLNPLEFMVW